MILQAKNVSFQYKENAPLVLQNISFEVKEGERVGLDVYKRQIRRGAS